MNVSEHHSFLIFSLNGSRYGVTTQAVQEIFFLPALTPIDEAPRDIVGVVNLRGEVLPVMDLNLRFFQRSLDYQITDSIIVIEWQTVKIGLIVNQVHEVQDIPLEAIAPQIAYGRQNGSPSHHYITGVAKNLGELVMLLNPEQLIEYSGSPETPPFELNGTEIPGSGTSVQKDRRFCPHATPEDMALFQERAENLMKLSEGEDFTGLMPIAVIGLNDEYFGLDLNVVREFTDIRDITPIPCCPSRIIGNMNLRGEIVTLIDIRESLNLPITRAIGGTKVMVVHIDELVAGIAIQEVCDVMYLHPSKIAPVPAAIHSANDEYLRGTAPYREKMMSLLDLPKILIQGELEVNEEP
ncbi:chemotaxis protein CheW [Laspinema olomoucense]|uniref:Chemotaxis protein CheW n=1 Tax=Laspinema olomoucense D3b TaxID=2953688 RepID=A0ABT2NHM8_9CYAN|nr:MULTISPECIES: chemotaxis protein CheW [unclassified Laspinema]MCT7974407.1 chemotaxis protein CheW [Laspinema sp. D3d]MCT7981240.1 chemotaxis protein CheW [Laspinema sp. D3b]